MTKLLIVESPNKIKTLKSILGADWNIQASLGHITELAHDGEDSLGFTLHLDRVECRYQPRADRGKKVIAHLREAAKRAELVYLATDPDREGEGISFHLMQQLRLKKGQYKRVTYTQSTDVAVKTAIANARELDFALVGAQQARQCLDKLVGYKVSPILWQSSGGKSAGRVQSPALHLVCDRERAIQNFKPTDYWSVWVEYAEGLRAYYLGGLNDAQTEERERDDLQTDDAADPSQTQQVESKRILSQTQADRLVQIAQSHPHEVIEFAGREAKKNPPPPLTTSSLQQAAGVRYSFGAEKTMQIAQALFEGVDLPQGRKALITYHRTDSVALAPEFCEAAQQWLTKHDPQNIPAKTVKHRDKSGAQGAHEAIRPTYLEITPESIQSHLSSEQFKLYDLIWRRAIASQCSPAQLQKTRAVIRCNELVWEARGSVVIFPGYTKYWNDLGQDAQLPTLRQGQALTLQQAAHTKKQTQPPARYSEAKLVQTLERLGIGRPSTYATTMKILKERGYVQVKGKVLVPTEVGLKTDEILAQILPNLVDAGLTAEMESALDAIADGERDWQRYLIAWNEDAFQPALARARQQLGVADRPAPKSEQSGKLTEHPCPVCRNFLEEYQYQKDGEVRVLLRCSNPKNRSTSCKKVAFFKTKQGTWWNKELGTIGDTSAPSGREDEISDVSCPDCSKPLSKIPSRKVTGGFFLKCKHECPDIVLFWSDRANQWEQPKPKSTSSTPVSSKSSRLRKTSKPKPQVS
jgi:DNA topoisomerase-1